MLKTKPKIKLLLALGIMLMVALVFNMNTVNAVTQEESQAMLDVIPDEITLDITEEEYEKADDLIKQKVETIVKNEGLSIEGMNISVYGTKLYYLDIHTATISISGIGSGLTKEVSVLYSNSNKRNSADEQAIKNMKIESPKYLTIDLNKCDNWEEMIRMAKEYYNNNISDKSIKIELVCGAGGAEFIGGAFGEHGSDIGILKNEIVYDIRTIGCLPFVPQIIIPDNINDTDADYINYAIPIIKQYLKENRSGDDIDWLTEDQINNLTIIKGGMVDYWNYNGNGKHNEFSVENGYTVKCNSQYGEETATIILKKAKSTSVVSSINQGDKITGIKLEATTNVVPANTILEVAPITEGAIFNTVKKALSEVKNFKVFDINLLSEGVKIQPNGKVKISIPVPTDFNKSNLIVYRVADNGEKTEYAVTVNGDIATFETDHFSTYVLAEKAVETTAPDTTNKREKDNTPKTGTTASIYYMISVAGISALGIIAFRRKETK